jgi:hypothetical protein
MNIFLMVMTKHIIFITLYSILKQVIALFVTLVSCMLLTWTVKWFEIQFQKCYGKIGNLHIRPRVLYNFEKNKNKKI